MKHFFLTCILLPLSMHAMQQYDINESFQVKIDQLVTAYHDIGTFSGTVLVAQNDTVIFNKAYGYANEESETLNKVDTKFKICSMTKQFTAAAILLLQERGKLKVDDPLSKFIPDYPRGNEITIHHLLTHTSGIYNYFKKVGNKINPHLPITIEKLIELFKDEPLAFKPGTQYDHSNSNYVLLTRIIELMSCQPYAHFLHDNIFKPLQMTNTRYDNHFDIIKDRAHGYNLNHNQDLVNALYLDPSIGSGAGALISTAQDLLKWNKALYEFKLLTEASIKQMIRPFIHFQNDYVNYDCGYGLFSNKVLDQFAIFHGGCADGFAGNVMHFPGTGVNIIILSNYIFSPICFLEQAIAAILFHKPYTIPAPRKCIVLHDTQIKPYIGTYQSRDNKKIVVAQNENQLIAKFDDMKSILLPTAVTTFFLKRVLASVTFSLDKQGNVQELILHTPHQIIQAKKLIILN